MLVKVKRLGNFQFPNHMISFLVPRPNEFLKLFLQSIYSIWFVKDSGHCLIFPSLFPLKKIDKIQEYAFLPK
jgi:hypothetical protein